MHLTNYSVNKKAEAYVKNTNSPTKLKTDTETTATEVKNNGEASGD